MAKSIDNWRSTGTLDDIEERAKRHLDGMTVNRDAMARDVLALVAAIRKAQWIADDGKLKVTGRIEIDGADIFGKK